MIPNDRETTRRVLGEAPVPTEVERRVAEGALRRMQRRRWHWRGLVAVAAAAAATAVVLLILWRGGHLTDESLSAPLERVTAIELSVGTAWTAGVQERTLAIGPHRAVLAPRARLRLVAGTPGSPRLALGPGSANFSVQPVRGPVPFTVETRHVRVVVLGTEFVVETEPRCTRVQVSRGLVRAISLRDHEQLELGPGEEHAFCERPAELDDAGRRVRRAISLAERGEQLAEAETLLAGYLEREPDGVYAQEAFYFLVLVKRQLGKQAEAARHARSFIARFPETARADALRAWLEK